MTETPRVTLCVKWGSPEQTGLSDWKYPFLCLSWRDSHAAHRDQTGTSGCISSPEEEKGSAPVWVSTPKHSAGGEGMAPHTWTWSQGLIETTASTSIEVLEEFMGTMGHRAVLQGAGRVSCSFLGRKQQQNTSKKTPKQGTKTKQKTLWTYFHL